MPESLVTTRPLLACLFFGASILYASVGHGGASAYFAVMGLLGMAPEDMKPIALSLNILVSVVALAAFAKAGHFEMRLFRPLAIASIPAAFVGGIGIGGEIRFISRRRYSARDWRRDRLPLRLGRDRRRNFPDAQLLGICFWREA